MSSDLWPALPLAAWRDTYETLHLWSQVVGKLTLTTTPLVNHYWNVTLHYTARGLETQAMSCGGGRTLTATFDFVSHELVLTASDGATESVKLEPRTVAEFHLQVMKALGRMGILIHIWTMPVEFPEAIRFEEDTTHRAYDRVWVTAFWRALESMRPVFEDFRSRFVGKCSPLHFFWGSFDLAVTRFSGRRAPELGHVDAVTRESYSHEVISHGFWPGGGGFDEAAFYAYAKPEPEGFRSAAIRPAAVRYDTDLALFLLPYEAVRSAASPEGELMSFLESTYEQGANLGHWNRPDLER